MKKLKILLIEDDDIERMKFSRVASKLGGHSIIEAENGEKALDVLDQIESPSLIILDLNMPKINGLEFLKTLKSNKNLQHIPIVVMSTSNNYNDIKKCYEIGVSGYMIKPLHYEDYQKKISNLINYWMDNELIIS
ncbi:response regulator [Pseudotenacibaculum sp. MALMAid0570]|uniref:response regulator n=1 Tax=Pseudotenacibaculum sp. MALMAid0570 TaxID=3143938 RepID=UPI0032DEA191